MTTFSFRYSPVFDGERPYHEKYSEDALLSYRQKFTDVPKGEEYVVLVAKTKYDLDKAQNSKAIIPRNDTISAPSAGENVIVGVRCWKLPPHSVLVGQFQNNTGQILNIDIRRNCGMLSCNKEIIPVSQRTRTETQIPSIRPFLVRWRGR